MLKIFFLAATFGMTRAHGMSADSISSTAQLARKHEDKTEAIIDGQPKKCVVRTKFAIYSDLPVMCQISRVFDASEACFSITPLQYFRLAADDGDHFHFHTDYNFGTYDGSHSNLNSLIHALTCTCQICSTPVSSIFVIGAASPTNPEIETINITSGSPVALSTKSIDSTVFLNMSFNGGSQPVRSIAQGDQTSPSTGQSNVSCFPYYGQSNKLAQHIIRSSDPAVCQLSSVVYSDLCFTDSQGSKEIDEEKSFEVSVTSPFEFFSGFSHPNSGPEYGFLFSVTCQPKYTKKGIEIPQAIFILGDLANPQMLGTNITVLKMHGASAESVQIKDTVYLDVSFPADNPSAARTHLIIVIVTCSLVLVVALIGCFIKVSLTRGVQSGEYDLQSHYSEAEELEELNSTSSMFYPSYRSSQTTTVLETTVLQHSFIV